MNGIEFQKAVASLLDQEEIPLVTKGEEHSLYSSAFHLYERKEYRKASSLFTRLVLINPFFVPYWKGLAASKQMSLDYEQAIQAWALATILDSSDPTNHLHAAECLYQMEDPQEARKALQAAMALLPEPNERISNLQKALYDVC